MDIEFHERLETLEEAKTMLSEYDELDEKTLLDIEVQKYYIKNKCTESYDKIKKKVEKSKEFEKEVKNTEKIKIIIKKEEICPLTQQKIQNPFISKCGHIMERSATIKYLKNKSKCPVVGCNKKLEENYK